MSPLRESPGASKSSTLFISSSVTEDFQGKYCGGAFLIQRVPLFLRPGVSRQGTHGLLLQEISHDILVISPTRIASEPLHSTMAIETIIDQKGIYFITFTCYNWLTLIRESNSYTAVDDFFYVLKREGHSITGYVIMPNHLHFLLHYVPSGKTLNALIGNGKRFIGYEIIKSLKKQNKNDLLLQLANGVSNAGKKKGKLHELWQPTFDAKQCRTEKFLLQKLNYIHENPVTGKWRLAESRELYLHSSASYYLRNKQPPFPVVHYDKLLDWENMYPANGLGP